MKAAYQSLPLAWQVPESRLKYPHSEQSLMHPGMFSSTTISVI